MRNDYVVIAAIILVALGIVFGPGLLPAYAAGNDPMPLCPPIGMAGGRVLYRCIDEQEGNVIYMNDLGFVFAVEW